MTNTIASKIKKYKQQLNH